jgi:hypothetical protein
MKMTERNQEILHEILTPKMRTKRWAGKPEERQERVEGEYLDMYYYWSYRKGVEIRHGQLNREALGPFTLNHIEAQRKLCDLSPGKKKNLTDYFHSTVELNQWRRKK